MSEPIPADYPETGRDWIDPAELHREAKHNNAEAEEEYIHQLAAVRKQFFSRLAAYDALRYGYGWGIFVDEPEGSTAEFGAREVLLKSQVRLTPDGAFATPSIRIITNEQYISGEYGDYHHYLSEDITIGPDDRSAYFMSATRLGVYSPPEQNNETVRESTFSLFYVDNGQLCLPFVAPLTPLVTVNCDLYPKVTTVPFGDTSNFYDQIYALNKARDILDSIRNLAPKWQIEHSNER